MGSEIKQYEPIILIIEGFIFFACLIFSAFFSAAETALTSMTKMRVKHLFTEGEDAYQKLEPWLREPNRYLATTLIGNNFINILASVIAADFFERILFGFFQTSYAVAYGSALAVGATTFFLLIFGEIVPKTYSKEHAPRLSLKVIGILDKLYRILKPIIWFFVFISNRIIILLGGPAVKEVPLITEEDMRALIEMSEKEGLLEEEEREMLHSIIDFGDTVVKEIMTPRVDFAALSMNASLEDARKNAIASGHSRIPVYNNEIDEIAGILYVKDLLRIEQDSPLSLKEIIRPAVFIPETTPLNILLRKLRHEKNHIAIVVDEYGVTVGLITIEDVLEVIVGDIQDEYDTEPPMYELQNDGSILADAKIYLNDLEEILKMEFPDKDVETLGGFVSTITGTVPQKGVKIEYENLHFDIIDADERKVLRILITIKPAELQEAIPEGNNDK